MKLRALLLAMLFVPTVAAWDDAADDHEVGLVYGNNSGEDQIYWTNAEQFDWYPQADIIRAEVGETQDAIIFEVEWAGNDGNEDTEPQEFFRLRYAFEFTLRGREMIGMFEHFLDDAWSDFEFFIIGMANPESYNGMDATASWPAEMVDETTLRVVFPKPYFRDDQFVPLRQGDVLQDIRVTVRDDDFGFPKVSLPACTMIDPAAPSASVQPCYWKVRDDVGTGNSLGNFEVELAPAGVGHLMVRSDRPWRLSNGLATTYLFEINVRNFDDESDEVLLSDVDTPKGWTVQYPSSVKFDGAGSQTVPVAVTVPFAHTHGRVEIFQLQAASLRDPAVEAGVFLGIIYADPAQPGGHHPVTYFHAPSSGFGSPWFNTDPTMEEGIDGDRSGTRFEGATVGPFRGLPTEATWTWQLRLQPSLQMGLDFQMGVEAIADFELEFEGNMEATITASLDVFGREEIHVMDLTGGSQSFEAGVATGVELRGIAEPEADRIPFGAGNLYLTITAVGAPAPEQSALLMAQPNAFLLVEGSTLSLPLIDFHDAVDLSGIKLNSFAISGNRTFAEVNPGKTMAFVFNVTNLLNEKQTLTWALTGSNVDWARVVPAETLVPGGGDGQVVVAVTPPIGANQGATAELLLLGTSKQDSSRQVFIRLTAYVELDDDIPDEAHVANEIQAKVKRQNEDLGKDSPGFEIAAVIAGLAAVLVMLRKRD